MADLKDMTRDEHYAAIEQALADAGRKFSDMSTTNRRLAEAQVHATLLVEKALLER